MSSRETCEYCTVHYELVGPVGDYEVVHEDSCAHPCWSLKISPKEYERRVKFPLHDARVRLGSAQYHLIAEE
jgi:hypothetical protein